MTSHSDVDLTTGGGRQFPIFLASLLARGGFIWGLRSRQEIDAWRGCRRNTANPLDANLWRIRGSDITANSWIGGTRSDGESEAMGGQKLWALDLHDIYFLLTWQWVKTLGDRFMFGWGGKGLSGGLEYSY